MQIYFIGCFISVSVPARICTANLLDSTRFWILDIRVIVNHSMFGSIVNFATNFITPSPSSCVITKHHHQHRHIIIIIFFTTPA